MAINEFFIVENSIVTQIVTCDDANVDTLYAGKTVVLKNGRLGNVGFMYANDKLWAPIRDSGDTATQFSKLGFRNLFTTDELQKIDGFEYDANLTTAAKAKFRTISRNLDLIYIILATDHNVTEFLNCAAEIGLITNIRLAEITTRMGATV